MQIRIQENIREQPELAAGVDRAVQVLQEEVAPSRFSGDVTAEWLISEEKRNGQEVKLRMYDPTASEEMNFSSKELENSDRLLAGIRRMWNHLLQARSEKQLEKVRQLLAEMEAEEED